MPEFSSVHIHVPVTTSKALQITRAGQSNPVFEVAGDGSILTGTGSAATAPFLDTVFRGPTAGFQATPLELATTQATCTNQLLLCHLFVAPVSFTITNVTVATGGTAAGATPTLIRAGIYTISGTTATLAASTASDTSLLAAASTAYTKALSSTYAVTRGTSYFFTFLVVTGATAPTVLARAGGNQSSSAYDAVFGSGLRLAGTIGSQADLPATFTTTNVVSTTTTNAVWAWFS